MTYPSNISTETYHYDKQLRNYIVQFMAIFSGLKVSVGQNDFDKQSQLIDVPIRYGSADRVVNAIRSDNTTNMPIRLPTMAANLTGIQLAPESRKGVNVVERRSFLERGRAFPGDIKVLERQQPVPYIATFDLSIMVSNTDQHFQILEQILTLFDPILQIQTSDDPHDWKRIATVELQDVGLDENVPAGADMRMIQSTLSFSAPIYLAPPTVINKNYIAAIKLRLAAIATNDSIGDIISDINAQLPSYETLISANEIDFPSPHQAE